MKESELRVGLLISGGGTTAEAVIKACQEKRLIGVNPIAVISSQPEAEGIQRAKDLGIKTFLVQRKEFPTAEALGERLLKIFKELDVDLVSQNGWLVKTPFNVVEEYKGRIINQHPGPLDPGRIDFGGKGMYGARVTCSRVVYEWIAKEDNPWTESTVHHVTENYDQGNLIQVACLRIPTFVRPVTIAELQGNPRTLVEITKKVQGELLPLEHKNVISALKKFAEQDSVLGFKREDSLIPKGNEPIVNQAKHLSIKLFPHA